MLCKTRCAILLAVAALFPLLAEPQVQPTFDAASIRPTEHGKATPDAVGYSDADVVDPGHFKAQNSTLDELIRFAWNLKDNEVSGPIWLNDSTSAFDIVATAPSPTSKAKMRLMLRTLLTDRFKLAAHHETRMLSGYELVVVKKGPKLTPADPQGQRSIGSAGGKIVATKVTVGRFADYLATDLKMPILDKTGIVGDFDITVQYSRDSDANSASIFTALQDELGLKLQPARVPVEILVVDHVEKSPTAN